jgi:hypothetical protein
MLLPISLRQHLRSLLGTIALAGLAHTSFAAQSTLLESATDMTKTVTKNTTEALSTFIDRLPDLLDIGLPSFAPPGSVRLYSHPRFGDLLHEPYFRLPVGVAGKLNDNLELNTELGSYFTHGLRGNVGNGLYQLRVGAKSEFALTNESGASTGIEYTTPLSRPPYEITDGLRHTVPYVTITRTIVPKWGLVGFSTLSFDFIDHTTLPVNYRKNQLRENSTTLTLGVAREWRRMHVIFTVFDGNTVFLSDQPQNVFGLRPSIGIPILRRRDGTPRATGTFEGRAVWGRDGFETGITTSVRFDLRYRGKKK